MKRLFTTMSVISVLCVCAASAEPVPIGNKSSVVTTSSGTCGVLVSASDNSAGLILRTASIEINSLPSGVTVCAATSTGSPCAGPGFFSATGGTYLTQNLPYQLSIPAGNNIQACSNGSGNFVQITYDLLK